MLDQSSTHLLSQTNNNNNSSIEDELDELAALSSNQVSLDETLTDITAFVGAQQRLLRANISNSKNGAGSPVGSKWSREWAKCEAVASQQDLNVAQILHFTFQSFCY